MVALRWRRRYLQDVNDIEWTRFRSRFPSLAAETGSGELVRTTAVVRHVPAGEIIYRHGDECTHLPLVLSGQLLLARHGETGRSITLYRVEEGESCILSTLSILNSKAFPAEASVPDGVTLVLVPASAVRRLVDEDRGWREFVFSMYHSRLASLITLVDEVLFHRVDSRLAELLVRESEAGTHPVDKTHHEIADDLGTSREVVSRFLKEWERAGYLALTRGQVTIRNFRAICTTAGLND